MPSIFSSPNPLLFGCGSSGLTGEKLKEYGCKKVLVVSDRGIKATGILEKIIGSIKATGIDIVLFDKVEANPPDYLVNEAGKLGIDEQVDGIVAVGGGSSLDTAKGARILLAYPPPINRYFAKLDAAPLDESNMKPLIVLPTTAGTGSEATPTGIITDTESHRKFPIICSVSLGIIDPELMINLPPDITASTGFDALCHAVEALTSRANNRISEVLAKESIRLIAKYLPTACEEGSNIEARERMALAATLAGMSLRGPFGGIPHGLLGSPLGTRYGVPHGIAVGCLLAETMKFIVPATPDKVKLVAQCMGAHITDDSSAEEIGFIACDIIRKLYKEINLPPMKTFIKSKQDMLDNIDKIYRNTSNTPRPITKEDAIEILVNSFDAF